MNDDNPYKLYLLDDKLVCKLVKGEIVWDVAIGTLVLIAEYTTNEGPMCDDYFLVFWSLEGEQLFEMKCSFYALDAIETMGTLLMKLNASTDLGLASSTEWHSRILWPTNLAGNHISKKLSLPQRHSEHESQTQSSGHRSSFVERLRSRHTCGDSSTLRRRSISRIPGSGGKRFLNRIGTSLTFVFFFSPQPYV